MGRKIGIHDLIVLAGLLAEGLLGHLSYLRPNFVGLEKSAHCVASRFSFLGL